MTARLLVLPVALVLLAGCTGPEEAPKPEEKPNPPAEQPPAQKPWSELLIGNWKRIDSSSTWEFCHEFTQDGQFIERVRDQQEGPRANTGTYRLNGNSLIFITPPLPSPSRNEIWERSTIIESLTEDQLITVTTIRIRLTPEMAQKLAEARNEPVGPFLADVREEQHRSVWARVK